ncbi:Wzy polymerase domain-containing protein [Rhizobacter sp. J219]|uniref:PglL family O-oligosaccharyltransferase n=1 Tax=Rhizobacter sp. J219 TaxID=2898430 RepID=UPI002151AF3D|nr:O-antigen ligase family protein [Rhizobacter sp. J219]MCR5884740.1 Wzy polymerase domain-containing protein [Rhizobacter sp. J219]
MQTNAAPLSPTSPTSLFLAASAMLAICGPAWLAYNVSPSATFLNQALSLGGWGWLLALTALCLSKADGERSWSQVLPLALAFFLVALGVGGSLLLHRLPSSLALSALGLIFGGCLAALTGAMRGHRAFQALCVGLLLAGLVNLPVAVVQVFAPTSIEGDWIARAGAQGRAGGNLRQPNHLSSLLLWSLAALVWLHDTLVEKSNDRQRVLAVRCVTAVSLIGLIFGDVLTVSRTGTVCVFLLALWGVLDRNLSRFTRMLLWAAPLIYGLCWLGMSEWSRAAGAGFIGDAQLQKSDLSSSRFAIWSNTIDLIKQNPWLGVGWGEFNFAWSLTPFPNRPVAFFDHTHNLPLNLLVELGIPLGTLALALLAWSLWKAFVACRITPQPHSTMVRTAFVMVLMMVVHSMLEYPLWYAYFLLPTAFALGICLGHSTPQDAAVEAAPASPRLRQALVVASLLLVAGTVFSVFDYLKVTKIFAVDDDDTTPLSYRIAQGQKSVFFAHHADYAAATVATHPSTAWKAFRRAPHLLLDTRLMMAWAKAYAEKGDIERARYIADRLREFRNPDSAEFFAECDKAKTAGTPEPFQCKPATRQFTYQDFKLR